jgi:membrane protein implicated in regulation of membrane protease activity
MLVLYAVMALVGGGLVLLSAFGGHDHHVGHGGSLDLQADHDSHIEVAHHGDVPASDVWIAFLSLRFWTYFATITGLLGLLLTLFTELSPAVVAGTSFATGFLGGLLVALLIRFLQRAEGGANIGVEDLIGADARVLVAIRPGEEGKVRCQVKGETIDILAVFDGEHTIPAGSEVMVVSVEGSRARVEPKGQVW